MSTAIIFSSELDLEITIPMYGASFSPNKYEYSWNFFLAFSIVACKVLF